MSLLSGVQVDSAVAEDRRGGELGRYSSKQVEAAAAAVERLRVEEVAVVAVAAPEDQEENELQASSSSEPLYALYPRVGQWMPDRISWARLQEEEGMGRLDFASERVGFVDAHGDASGSEGEAGA